MTDDTDTVSTLSREDALALECEETDEEFALSMEYDSDDDTEAELEQEDEADDFWPTDEQVAAWEESDAQWRNPEAYWGVEGLYDPSGEI